MVLLKIGHFTFQPFDIFGGTPQGSPLSPIILALYIASLLQKAKSWDYRDLTLYMDDGAIYATSTTKATTVDSALARYKLVTNWLQNNGLKANLSKTELMTFTKGQQLNLTGGQI